MYRLMHVVFISSRYYGRYSTRLWLGPNRFMKKESTHADTINTNILLHVQSEPYSAVKAMFVCSSH